MQPNDTTNTHQVDTTKPTTQTSTTPATSAASPTLEDYTDWLNELHCANFDALDAAATDDAYRTQLDRFTRSNIAVNLLAQFMAAHLASQQLIALALMNEGGAA